ncbi:MAG: limonene-1,2-epoxide hydrolase family protein [Acidimicrobiia bacterium]|nr:limonene-1,2-epoxide hydrolase family protein [Acidimicrobiia bacterium]
MSEHDNGAIITAFCDAWTRGDADAIVAAFTDDAVYHNIPMQAIAGREQIDGFIRPFLATGSITFDTLRQVVDGDIVMNERVDTVVQGDRTIELPVMGVFELRDGKISAWRDYFDLQTFIGG